MSNRQKGTQDQIEVGEHIRAARNEMGLTQEELAELVGIDRNTVYRYEAAQGGNMSIEIFFKFAAVLKKTPTELAPSRFSECPEGFVLVKEIVQKYDKKDVKNIVHVLKLFSEL